MRSGWQVGGLALALFVAAPLGRAGAADPPAEGKPPTAEEKKKVKDLQAEAAKAVEEGKYEEAEKTLGRLIETDLKARAGKDDLDEKGELLNEKAKKEVLKQRFDEAVEKGRYDYAAYYLDRLGEVKKSEETNIFAPALDLTIWTIVVFLILLFVLSKYAWKPMLAGLEKREKDIHAAVADAQKAREEAQRLKEEIQAERDKMAAMHRETIDQARAEAQRVAEEISAQAKAEAQAERDRLRREIATEYAQAQRDLFARVAELATLVSAKAIRRQLSEEDHRRLVDEALAELGPAAGERQRSVANN
jgi:F-type H+-transporting ATPase subunit b